MRSYYVYLVEKQKLATRRTIKLDEEKLIVQREQEAKTKKKIQPNTEETECISVDDRDVYSLKEHSEHEIN